jgi:flagellar export protein FliJ
LKTFQFKFEPLLNLRRYRRDLCRQLLAGVLDDDARLVAERRRLEETRHKQLAEMRRLGEQGVVDVGGSSARRYYSGQLTVEMRLVDHRREVVAQQIELCRQALVRADQDVKALEKIAEKLRGEYEYEQDRRAAHELEDAWSAVRAVEAGR